MKTRVAEILLNIGCFQFRPQEPFTYASGLRGPVYCDNRILLSQVEAREEIINYFLDLILEVGPLDVVAGMATAGIPYASWVAQKLKKPLIYVRSQAKEHGKQNLIEGRYQPGAKVILMEDLVNQAKSSGLGLDALGQGGLVPLGLFCIVNYEMEKAKQEMIQRNCPLFSLTDFSSLIQVALKMGMITSHDFELLRQWQKDPSA